MKLVKTSGRILWRREYRPLTTWNLHTVTSAFRSWGDGEEDDVDSGSSTLIVNVTTGSRLQLLDGFIEDRRVDTEFVDGSSWGELVALCWELERYASNTPRGLRVLIQLTCVTLECCLDHASLILRLKPKYCTPRIYASPQNVTLITLLMKCATAMRRRTIWTRTMVCLPTSKSMSTV